MKNIPSPQQMEQFDKHVAFWQQKLSLGDWRIERGIKLAKNAMASVEFDVPARLATYRIGDFGAEQITEESLSKTALHEILHIFLHDLITLASDHRSTDEQLESAEHRVINVLERVLYVSTKSD